MATEQPLTRSELHEMLTQEREANRDTFRFELRDTLLQEREANRETFRSELRDTLQHYATKADLAEVRGEIKAMRWPDTNNNQRWQAGVHQSS